MTTWYLWAVHDDPRTNEYLVKVIGEQNPECLFPEVKCADGMRRNLFRCPHGYHNVMRAIAAIPEHGLKIEVFKEEICGIITQFNLWKPVVRKRSMRANLRRSMKEHPRRIKDKQRTGGRSSCHKNEDCVVSLKSAHPGRFHFCQSWRR